MKVSRVSKSHPAVCNLTLGLYEGLALKYILFFFCFFYLLYIKKKNCNKRNACCKVCTERGLKALVASSWFRLHLLLLQPPMSEALLLVLCHYCCGCCSHCCYCDSGKKMFPDVQKCQVQKRLHNRKVEAIIHGNNGSERVTFGLWEVWFLVCCLD